MYLAQRWSCFPYQTLLTYEEYISVYQAVYGLEKAACIKRLP